MTKGLVQLFVQWLCALGLYVEPIIHNSAVALICKCSLGLVLGNSHAIVPDTHADTLENNEPSQGVAVGVIKYVAALITYVVIFLMPAVLFFLDPSLDEVIGGTVLFGAWTMAYMVPLSTLFALWQAIPQLLTTWRLQTAHALSPLSLGLRTLVSTLLAISWWFHLDPPPLPDGGFQAIFTRWYREGAWLTVNFSISAIAHLAMCIASMTAGRRSIVDVTEEQRPLLSGSSGPSEPP